MVFNIMCRNQDDHVENISFVKDRRGTWSLFPAYDVTIAYNPNGTWTAMHQMVINGKRSQFNIEDLLQSARAMNISQHHALRIIEEVKQATMRWSEFS
ncbi:hypothetical protein AOC36_10815 [Erysipelothrix larvae]|uniref:HipA-like C-terminal domain-containing protein n=1 Tax=Erysipelothrix larvae TaxID=1514105 RepID=A0A0X8H1T1_9FIRM|nr:HipA domain-containing protein [Erysipelothrix larvae]AMC94445.1 hypothetical protein AOC36_10815 [Erysipelothrix larvae]